MSTLAISLVSDPDWEVRLARLLHSVEEAAQRVKATLARERVVVKFYLAMLGLNARMDEFVAFLDQNALDLQHGKLEHVPGPDENVEPLVVIKQMEYLYLILQGVHTLATVVGLKKRLLTKGVMKKLDASNERLLDYIVWLRDAATPEAYAAVEKNFADALTELEAGDTVAFQ